MTSVLNNGREAWSSHGYFYRVAKTRKNICTRVRMRVWCQQSRHIKNCSWHCGLHSSGSVFNTQLQGRRRYIGIFKRERKETNIFKNFIRLRRREEKLFIFCRHLLGESETRYAQTFCSANHRKCQNVIE